MAFSLALARATLLLPLFTYQLATDSSWLGSFPGSDGVAPFRTGSSYAQNARPDRDRPGGAARARGQVVLRVVRSGIGLQLMAMAEDERLGESIGVTAAGLAEITLLLVEPDGVAGGWTGCLAAGRT